MQSQIIAKSPEFVGVVTMQVSFNLYKSLSIKSLCADVTYDTYLSGNSSLLSWSVTSSIRRGRHSKSAKQI
jgi:hypothetical protein